jgi:alkylation response protein AidB-like acyl-CoA dehydrogenase
MAHQRAEPTTLSGGLRPVTEAGRALCGLLTELTPFLTGQAADNDRAGTFARASVQRLNEAGILAACAPVEDGGSGLESLYDLAVVLNRLGRADPSVAIGAAMHLALSWYYARTVRTTPVERQAELPMRDWLRAIGKREMIVCSSVAEPGTHPWELQTTAVRSADGWVISGRKVMASISPAATHFYTRVKGTDAAGGDIQASVMIPLDLPGVEVRDTWNGLGLRGSGSGEVLFTDVAMPAAALSPRGRWGVQNTWYEGRAAQAAPTIGLYLGIAEAARQEGLAAAAGPGVAGRDRTRSAGSQAMLAELELALSTARAVLHTSLVDLDERVTDATPREFDVADGRRLLKESVTAALVVERAAGRVIDLAMQLAGGRSFGAGHPLGRMYRDIRAASFMRPWAPSEEWTDFVADVALEGFGRSDPAAGGGA